MALTDFIEWNNEEKNQSNCSNEEKEILQEIRELNSEISSMQNELCECGCACCACIANSLSESISELEGKVYVLKKRLEELRKKEEIGA